MTSSKEEFSSDFASEADLEFSSLSLSLLRFAKIETTFESEVFWPCIFPILRNLYSQHQLALEVKVVTSYNLREQDLCHDHLWGNFALIPQRPEDTGGFLVD